MHVVVWNGFAQELQVFNGHDDFYEVLHTLAELHLEEGNDVIYFYAWVDSITLREC